MKPALLATMITLSHAALAQSDDPVQPAFDYRNASQVFVAIVEPTAVSRVDSKINGRIFMPARIETVRVVDSDDLPSKRSLRVFSFDSLYAAPSYKMQMGHRYLLLAPRPLRPRPPIPFVAQPELGSAPPTELQSLAILETSATKLARGKLPADSIVESVVDCLVRSSDTEVKRTTNWLSTSGYPGGGNYTNPFGRAGFALTDKILKISTRLPAVQQIPLGQLLCSWHIFGGEKLLLSALVSAAPDVNGLRAAIPFTGGEFNFTQMKRIQDPS